MEGKDKIKKALISIQKSNPFWAFLSFYLKIEEAREGELPEWANAGVDAKGNLKYKREYIEELTDDGVKSVIVHEILHLVFLHLLRQGKRDKDLFNISADVKVNELLRQNEFWVSKDWIVPKEDNTIEIFGKQIIETHKKSAEEIYDELPKSEQEEGKIYVPDGNGNVKMEDLGEDDTILVDGEEQGDSKGEDGEGDSSGDKKGGKSPQETEGSEDSKEKPKKKGKPKIRYRGFDYHKDSEVSDKEKRDLEKSWAGRVAEAYELSKLKGDTPAGIERLVGKLHKETINWKALLHRFITQQIPHDYSFHRPHKKSASVGTYLPYVTKEKIDIVVGIDLSGSIGQEELNDFISEVVGIARAYQNRVNMRLISHDVDVHTDLKIENGNIQKIKKIELKGGGGTSHEPIFNHIKDKVKDCKAVVFFTDGYSDLDSINFNKYPFHKLFIITKHGDDREVKGKKCQVVKLK